jgi:adenylate cyclase
MPANIEIKAVLTDSVSAHAIATRLSGAPAEVVDQTDIFFPCAGGRFKLRVRGPNDGELIFYDRPDGPGLVIPTT